MKERMYDTMVRCLLKKEDKEKYSHLIIVNDKEDDEYVKIFVKREKNIKDVLFDIVSIPIYEIKEIYNYDMDLEQQIKEYKAYHINPIYNKTKEAYEFAKNKHNGQIRKNNHPYIDHPINVAEIIKRYFSEHPKINELITAAYLHDTVEDTSTTITEIKERFGEYVAYLVNGVTNNEEEKHKMGKTDYLCNKMLNMNEDVLNLKLCDRLANVLDLNNAPDDFINKYTIETLIIINYLINNRTMDSIKLEIIKEINEELNNLRKAKILKLVKNNAKS